MFYLTGYEQWQCTASSVPGMGFSGIAAGSLPDAVQRRNAGRCAQGRAGAAPERSEM